MKKDKEKALFGKSKSKLGKDIDRKKFKRRSNENKTEKREEEKKEKNQTK